MSDPLEDDERWTGEGGHEAPTRSQAELLAEIRAADRSELSELWEIAVRDWGEHTASRLWQQALSESDASET